MVWIVDGDSVSFGSVKAGVVCNGGRAVNELVTLCREFRCRCLSGLDVGDWRLREFGREEAGFLCGLARGEWSTGVQLLFCGENVRLGRGGCTAPLLARVLRVFELLTDVTLELVECDHLLRLPSPSVLVRSVESTAILLLRLWSCDIGSRSSLRAMSDVSDGLCAFVGAVEFRTPVPVELSEPGRFTVTTDAEESELECEEDRRCL